MFFFFKLPDGTFSGRSEKDQLSSVDRFFKQCKLWDDTVEYEVHVNWHWVAIVQNDILFLLLMKSNEDIIETDIQ